MNLGVRNKNEFNKKSHHLNIIEMMAIVNLRRTLLLLNGIND